jgi:glycogen operon protein
VRDFWRGGTGVRSLAYRLSGSQDLYGWNRRPWASVNLITAHDGFTLRDVVSYADKHNEANGERNQDGTNDNRSANYGVEGETDDPSIRALRLRQARNMLATLLLSTGTPMLTMGDEVWRTQAGNNNAYCQTGPLVWVDWPAAGDPDSDAGSLLAFAQHVLTVRAQAPALHQGEFFDGRRLPEDGLPDLVWFDPDGEPMDDTGWYADGRTIQMWVNGRDVRGHGPSGEPLSDETWLLVVHAGSESIEITLPDEPFGLAYTPVIDTAAPTGKPADPSPLSAGVEVTLPGRTLWLLQAHRLD